MQTLLNRRNGLGLLAVLILILGLGAGSVSAQTPDVAGAPNQRLGVFISENKIVTLDFSPEEITSSAPGIVKAEKVKGADNQIAVTGVASGDATLTLRNSDKAVTYDVSVSPMPERLYINIPESKRLAFTANVDEVVSSTPGIVRVNQPTDKVLLIEALRAGKTTVTVTCGNEIYRYFVSTFDNRGADLLEIQNAFAAKGYSALSVAFANDQAMITGTVPTQEELDDAVRIVKQYTPYVIVKATVGAVGVNSEDTPEEQVIINNILKIANVKGLIVKVKFPPMTEVHATSYSKVVGTPVLSNTVTDNQTRLTTSSLTLPPVDASGGTTERLPEQGSVETVSTSRSLTLPEKIFLFGELDSDLDEAKAIRVARTYCPLVISFITVKDPIQLRVRTRIVEVDIGKVKDTGILWTNANHNGPPTITFGFHSPNTVNSSTGQISFSGDTAAVAEGLPPANPPAPEGVAFEQAKNLVNFTLNHLFYDFGVDASGEIRLLETRNMGKTLFDQNQLLTNGQPGEFFDGSSIPYSAGSTTGAAGTTVSTAFVSVGLTIDIVPLNNVRAGGAVPGGRTTTTLPKYIPGAGGVVDESIKYVDENGMIGLDITTNVSALSQFVNIGNGTQAPQTTSRTTVNRSMVRDGQSIVATGLFNSTITRAITAVPFFNKIPIFGFLFENPVDNLTKREIFVIFTPTIVRMKDPDTKRMPKPIMPEMQKELVKQEDVVPQIKPVRYDAGNIDVRPDLLKPAVLQIPNSTEIRAPAEPAAPVFVTPAVDVTPLPPPAPSASAETPSAPAAVSVPEATTATTPAMDKTASPAAVEVTAPAVPAPASQLPVEQPGASAPTTSPPAGGAGRLKMPDETGNNAAAPAQPATMGIHSYEGTPAESAPGAAPGGMGVQTYEGTPSQPSSPGTDQGNSSKPSIDTAAPSATPDQSKNGADDSSTIP